MFKLFKKTNERGNYPKPKHMSKAEMEKRSNYNREQVFKEIYVPNKELENLVGCSLLNEAPQINRNLTDVELDRALYLASVDFMSFAQAAKNFTDIHEPIHKQYMTEYKEYLRTRRDREKMHDAVKPIGDESIFTMTYIRDLYNQSRFVRDVSKGNEINEEMSSWNREQKLESLKAHLNMRLTFRLYFSTIEACAGMTGNNMHGAKVPLYEIY